MWGRRTTLIHHIWTIRRLPETAVSFCFLCLHNAVYIIFCHNQQKVEKFSIFLAKIGILAYIDRGSIYVNNNSVYIKVIIACPSA